MSEPASSKALVWDKAGQRYYENGVDHCALYLQNSDGAYGKGGRMEWYYRYY